jgi:endonuclease/exonuclease/phosphatase (EEP) superfamily protein YafD
MKKLIVFAASILFSFLVNAADISILCNQETLQDIYFSNQIIPRAGRPANEVTLITWNAHKLADENFFYDLKKLSTDADILMVQEAVHTTNWQNAFAAYMPFSFTFFKSFCWGDSANGVLTGSRFPLSRNTAVLSPGTEPITFTHKVSGYSQIVINNQVVHIINTHALNFNPGTSFEEQIDQLVKFIGTLKGAVIWAGDFNTWNPLRKSYLNEQTAKVGLTHDVPSNDDRFLILDHIYVRGFSMVKTEVVDEKSSDHVPLRTTLRLN